MFGESERVAARAFKNGASHSETRNIRFEFFLNKLGISRKHSGDLVSAFVEHYPAINAPVPGTGRIIKQLWKKYPLGIISNGHQDVQVRKLEILGLKSFFDCIVLAGELGLRKPDPNIFWRACSMLDKEPAECIYIGNSFEDDVMGAKKAGLAACWFNRFGHIPAHKGIKPDFEINSLDELAGLLDNGRRRSDSNLHFKSSQ